MKVFMDNTDILERLIRKTIVKQSRLDRKLASLSLVCLTYGVLQMKANLYLWSEISDLKDEVKKLKQKNGE